MTNRAIIDQKSAYLSTEFGEQIARKWFGDRLVDEMPRFTRGVRKGKLKGVVRWQKVARGGWVSTGRETASGGYSGYVENRVGRIFDRELRHDSAYGSYELGALVINIDDTLEDIASIERRIEQAQAETEPFDVRIADLETKKAEYLATDMGQLDEQKIVDIIDGMIAETVAEKANVLEQITRLTKRLADLKALLS